jgi:hypothetical protein
VLRIENVREDGSKARIVYRNDGGVDAPAVEELCTKVGLVLKCACTVCRCKVAVLHSCTTGGGRLCMYCVLRPYRTAPYCQ